MKVDTKMENHESSTRLIVVGQGYVGLPVAMRAVEVGYDVIGIDLDSLRVSQLRNGVSYVDDVESSTLEEALATGRYLPTNRYEDIGSFDIAVITVPTPLREGLPDLSFIESATQSLAGKISNGSVIILESTTYPGTTQELVVPALEEGSGLSAGKDFYVGYSPERIDPGNKTWGFVETPKVVSGINSSSLERVQAFYDDLIDQTVAVQGTKEAELTKLLENTFRHVNIALVNELAIFANQLGVNVWEAIEAASSKPFGYMKFTPGPGVGGHCLPVDPSYLSWQVKRKLRQNFRFVELANDVNDHMPDYVMQRLISILNSQAKPLMGSKVLIAGLAYKKNTGDIRESPSVRLIDLLLEYGAEIAGADGHVEAHRWPHQVKQVELTVENIASADVVVLITEHDHFDLSTLEEVSTPVLDTRNVLRGPNVQRL